MKPQTCHSQCGLKRSATAEKAVNHCRSEWYFIRSSRARKSNHFTNSISPALQLLSKKGFRGLYALSIVNQPLPGVV